MILQSQCLPLTLSIISLDLLSCPINQSINHNNIILLSDPDPYYLLTITITFILVLVVVFRCTMDIVLEVCDTFLFDRFWSNVYPARVWNDPKNSIKDATATFSSMRELPTPISPSTQFFQLAPSRYAYMSEWGRDNTCRQFLSLYLITWYTLRPF